MSEEIDKLNKDIALAFLLYLQSEYYEDCGYWHNKNSQESKSEADIYDKFIEQYKYDRT